ncbi:MAG: hypothetical protein IT208_09075 [Chthonomonadales bacterium]|nr:hypothetical protein [Chthonomonadales bacterium]
MRVFLAALLACALCGSVAAMAREGRMASGDAVVTWNGSEIRLETARARRVLAVDGGRLALVSWLDRRTKRDLAGGRPSADFVLRVDGRELRSDSPGWQMAEPAAERGKDGEIRIQIAMERDGVAVRRHYVVYPGLSLLRLWLTAGPSGTRSVEIAEPPMTELGMASAGRLLWMTGAEPFGDSWQLREETLGGEPRVLDSYDAPPATPSANDGVDLRILLNDRAAWPPEGWARSTDSASTARHDLALEVRAGDRIAFVVGRHGNITCDTTEWDPIVAYEGGERHQASAGFSGEQGRRGWRYAWLGDDGRMEEMVYDAEPGPYGKRWRRKIGVIEPFVGPADMHPDGQGAAVRLFVAPRDGHVRVTGVARNTGNTAPAGPGFRMGSQTRAPWLALRDDATGQAAYLGFDCIAHWRATISARDGAARADVALAGYRRRLGPGQTLTTPTAFTGLFSGDLDEMGQELLEWQYRYLWDYTREPWFAGVRLLGYWYKGTSWPTPFAEPHNDMEAAYRKAFRTTELMREVGGDTYHRDWGWWDRVGDWNGPNFRDANDFLRLHGMGLLLYAYVYHADPTSAIARAHPDWLIDGSLLDQSLPAVVDFEAAMLDAFYRRYGPYQWRNDAGVIAPRDGDDTSLLAQQQGFLEVARRFLDSHPDCAMHGVNGGGFAINWEYLRLTSGFQFTDGQSGAIGNHYISYLFPPDKINDMPDIWDPEKYDPATWRGLLCANIDFTGDTFDPAKLEGIRLILDIYHYLRDRGVAGRWTRIYHPVVEGDRPEMYLQRLSWNRRRGMVVTRHHLPGAVTLRLRGLLPGVRYRVDFQEDARTFNATGRELMERGIELRDAAPGELIYLNLPDHPGNREDRKPPSRPSGVRAAAARHMGVPGVQVRWEPGRDDRWLSGYEVLRDGEPIGRVAKGRFLFDHSVGADPSARYAVVSIDGSGNRSAAARAPLDGRPRRFVLDDAEVPAGGWKGDWRRESGFAPAHRRTLSWAEAPRAALELRFTGTSVRLHGRLGLQGGLARVSVDGGEPTTVSCYGADEIPGWTLYERDGLAPGEHWLTVEVPGERDPRGRGARVWIDGVSAAP